MADKLEPIVTNVEKRKRNGMAKDIEIIGRSIFKTVLIPLFKKMLWDTVTNGMEMMLYPDGKGRPRSSAAGQISYRAYYDKDRVQNEGPSIRNKYVYEDLVFKTYGEAELVLDRLGDILSREPYVTIADLLQLVDMSYDYPDKQYGWTDLSSSRVTAVKDGYVLKLPTAMPVGR